VALVGNVVVAVALLLQDRIRQIDILDTQGIPFECSEGKMI
jgi:hypothetical protein